jgi:hypothetical protein
MSKTKETAESTPPSVALLQLTIASWLTQAVYAAAKLGVADLLKSGPLSYRELAAATDSNPSSLYRVLRALASLGVFEELDNGRFALTPIADCLRSDAPGSLRAFATMAGSNWHWKLVGEMINTVQSGAPSFDRVFHMSTFEFFTKNREDGSLFDQAMTSLSAAETAAVIAAYDFGRFERLIDIGGGHGSLLLSALKQNPELKGVLYDLPPVAQGATEIIRKENLSDRCEVIAGDFFKSAPAGGDAYVVKHIIHDWDDDLSISILKNCCDAMEQQATLLIIEMVIPPGNEPFFGKWLDLEMLLIGGRERTEAEYRELLYAAGFKLTKIFPTQSPVSVIEAVRRD